LDKRNLLVNPTLACGNPLNYAEDLDMLKEVGNTIIHIDIMDGHYVPNLAFDLGTIREIRKRYDFLIDVHLMVTNPETYVDALAEIGVDFISFHLDATAFSIRLLRKIKGYGIKAGIVINPSQPVSFFKFILPHADYVLVMAVEPGFSGQRFISDTFDKISELNSIREAEYLEYLIEVDGGIDEVNCANCIRVGADILVSGAFGVFQRKNGLKEDYLAFRKIIDREAH